MRFSFPGRKTFTLVLDVQVKELAAELDVGFLTIGFDPKWEVKDVPIMPKNRYRSVDEAIQWMSAGLEPSQIYLYLSLALSIFTKHEKTVYKRLFCLWDGKCSCHTSYLPVATGDHDCKSSRSKRSFLQRRVMADYMPRVGNLGHDMMFRSTTIQVSQSQFGKAIQPWDYPTKQGSMLHYKAGFLTGTCRHRASSQNTSRFCRSI